MEETSSTQFELANNFLPGKVLVAEFQSAGRGRLNRKFEVPPRKGLTFSFAINAEKDFGWIPLITGLAVSKAINNYVGENIVEIKWPNDLLVNGKKLAGILSEKVESGAVVGVGINIFQEQNELPIQNALSLSMVTKVDRTDLLVAILNELGDALSKIENFRNEYREKCTTIGKTVQVTLPNGDIIEDLAVGISDSGALLLNSREITVGDIVHLR